MKASQLLSCLVSFPGQANAYCSLDVAACIHLEGTQFVFSSGLGKLSSLKCPQTVYECVNVCMFVGMHVGPGLSYCSLNGANLFRDPCCNENSTIGTRIKMNLGNPQRLNQVKP